MTGVQTCAEDILDKNKTNYENIEKACACSEFELGVVGGKRRPLGALSWIDITRLLRLQAKYYFNQSEEEKAFDEAIRTIALANLSLKGRGGCSNILYSSGISSSGHGLIRDFIKTTNLPPETLKRYIGEIERFHIDNEDWITNLKAEYIIGKKTIEDIESGKIDPIELLVYSFPTSGLGRIKRVGYSFKPNETRRMLYEFYKIFIANRAKKDFMSDYDWMLPSFYDDSYNIRRFKPNNLGRILVSLSGFSIIVVEKNRFQTKTIEIASAILIALKCYKTEHGDLPATLNELVPVYFKEFPKDPYDAKPFRYSKEKKIIWAVDMDLTDDEGYYVEKKLKKDEMPTNVFYDRDLVFKIDF